MTMAMTKAKVKAMAMAKSDIEEGTKEEAISFLHGKPPPRDDGDNTSECSTRQRRMTMTLAPRRSLILNVEESSTHPPTSYLETIVHLFKGNIGPGLFAMGDAFKNGGLLMASLLTIVIALICIHCQHVLVNCSTRVKALSGCAECPDYADTVEQCFQNGPARWRPCAAPMRVMVNIFICVTQLGFCCIYFVFISKNVEQILIYYGIDLSVRWIMLIAFIPILMTSLITNLKWLSPVSLFANVCMISGLGVTLYFALCDGLPELTNRNMYTNPSELALFFGTAIFAFEGIALVLPLKNAMRAPGDFERSLGVLNVGMFLVTCMFMFAGFVGYLKWGERVGGSLTLNLGNTVLAQCVKFMVSTGVLFGYPIQFFIAIQIMWPNCQGALGLKKHPFAGELLFRTLLVILTLGIAEMVPELNLFISLIGALCSTALALIFPPVMELIIEREDSKSSGAFLITKNVIIIALALLGFITGSYESLARIIKFFF